MSNYRRRVFVLTAVAAGALGVPTFAQEVKLPAT